MNSKHLISIWMTVFFFILLSGCNNTVTFTEGEGGKEKTENKTEADTEVADTDEEEEEKDKPSAAKSKITKVSKKGGEEEEEKKETETSEEEKSTKTDTKKVKKGSAVTVYDLPKFMRFDLAEWKQVSKKAEEGEGDAWGTTYVYKKGNQTLEFIDGYGSYGYFPSFKLLDAKKKVLKEWSFNYSDGYMTERVVDYTTDPAKEYTREDEKKVAYEKWESPNRPINVDKKWKVKELGGKSTKKAANKADTNTPKGKLTQVTSMWNGLKQGYSPDKSRDGTWLDVGFRSKYAMAKKYASIKMVEAAFGMPVFKKGPHKGDMDFNNKSSFGHYNPEFIEKLRMTIEDDILADPKLKAEFKKIWKSDLESMARTYLEAGMFVMDDQDRLKELQKKYKAAMKTGNGSMMKEFSDFAENGYKDLHPSYKKKNPNRDEYEAISAPAFWVRRSIDGTDSQLLGMLDMIIKEMER